MSPRMIKKAQVLLPVSDQEERVVGRARVLIASSLWAVASLTHALTAGPVEAQGGGVCVQGAFSQPYPFFLSEEVSVLYSLPPNKLLGFSRFLCFSRSTQ